MVEGLTSFRSLPKGSCRDPWSTCRDARSVQRRVEDMDPIMPGTDDGARRRSRHHNAEDPGDSSGEAIPVPIPNTEVKLSSAEDTQGVAPRENRSSPGSLRVRGMAWTPRDTAG